MQDFAFIHNPKTGGETVEGKQILVHLRQASGLKDDVMVQAFVKAQILRNLARLWIELGFRVFQHFGIRRQDGAGAPSKTG